MSSTPPNFVIDRPLSWVHFRLTVDGWHPLVAMQQPSRGTRWNELKDLGIRKVLRLSEESQPYDPSPLQMLGMVIMEINTRKKSRPTPCKRNCA